MGNYSLLETNSMQFQDRLAALVTAVKSDEVTLAGLLIGTQGKVWHLKPSSGNDAADGSSAATAFKTLSTAKDACTANQNDVVLYYAESNTSANTTDYQESTVVWDKDLTHLVGVNAGGIVSQRSRVAFASNYDTASNLITVSANGCLFSGLQFYAGVAGTNPTGCLKVTGSRNVFRRCHIAGIGHDNNDIAGAWSLKLDGASENVFDECAIGLDTIGAGTAANSEILVDTDATRNMFKDCLIFRWLDHATQRPLVKLNDATAVDRWLWFRRCMFLNMSVNNSIKQAGIFKFGVSPTQGFIVVEDCKANVGDNSATAVKWDVDDLNKLTIFNSVIATDTAGTGFMS